MTCEEQRHTMRCLQGYLPRREAQWAAHRPTKDCPCGTIRSSRAHSPSFKYLYNVWRRVWPPSGVRQRAEGAGLWPLGPQSEARGFWDAGEQSAAVAESISRNEGRCAAHGVASRWHHLASLTCHTAGLAAGRRLLHLRRRVPSRQAPLFADAQRLRQALAGHLEL